MKWHQNLPIQLQHITHVLPLKSRKVWCNLRCAGLSLNLIKFGCATGKWAEKFQKNKKFFVSKMHSYAGCKVAWPLRRAATASTQRWRAAAAVPLSRNFCSLSFETSILLRENDTQSGSTIATRHQFDLPITVFNIPESFFLSFWEKTRMNMLLSPTLPRKVEWVATLRNTEKCYIILFLRSSAD